MGKISHAYTNQFQDKIQQQNNEKNTNRILCRMIDNSLKVSILAFQSRSLNFESKIEINSSVTIVKLHFNNRCGQS
jgi:hypothetical protein